MKTYVTALLLIIMFVATVAFAADNEKFPRFIQKGDRGADVLLLQQILNSDPDTQVAAVGSGSPGNETELFGELTHQAVIKLQKKHNLGTKYGFFTIYSGTLDDKTRKYLNGLPDPEPKDECQKEFKPTDAQSLMNLRTKIEGLNEALKPENVAKNGIASTTQRWKDLNQLYRISAQDSSSAPYIRNIEISSKDNDKGLFLPFSPSMMFKSGDQMKIVGCNFATSTKNTVRMTFGTQEGESKDGKTIILEIKSPLKQMFDTATTNMSDTSLSNTTSNMPQIPTFVTVQNDKGISNPYQLFMSIQ